MMAASDHGGFASARIAILGPFPPRSGGVARQCAILAQHLQQAGVQVIRINTDLPTWRGRALARPFFPLAQVVHGWRALGRTRHGWDILHVHAASWWGFMPAVLGLRARAWGKHLVLTYHGGEAAAFMAKHGAWARAVLQRYDRLLTLTPTQARIFQAHGLTPFVVPNIVPLEQFPFRLRGPVRPRLLWLRLMEDRYRPQDALAVLAQVRAVHPHATLTLVGGGKCLAQLRAQAPPGARFLGQQPFHALPALYDAAEIFLNTSAVDNLPLTLIEASASGLPIVSTNAGAIPDLIVHGQHGLLARVGDVDALAGHVLRLLDDPRLAQKLSKGARENAQRFRWEAIAPQLARAYDLFRK